ncbi:HAD family hydrolase [Neoroseomonas oryzicola]|uniref:Haloacid dehalogenase-like hydrolase n=1 Tax=Neoroseomonas oryzicola TaxID=535904 RepID=A0A9X9WBS9_9PROT|nr:HAD family hydrolase [Neoroseomonas oryzicola]MBR0657789.1 haloacid dehalogenase-like hydrolase [Neoroseomonas oryzicola]NKE18643.1 haloacid dehalogenase-like hydrolase [Neoroseomonas oryzicola]
MAGVPVAIAYDFDGTLAEGNMQEHVFLPKLGLEKRAFWDRANALAKDQQGDKILTYMHRMLVEAAAHDIPMRREDWAQHGAGIRLFPGVETWFQRIDAQAAARGLSVEHYVISSGLRELIEGTSIRKHFRAVFASGFLYNASGAAIAPAIAVNYTTKTQYLFRINKDALDLADDTAVNAYQPQERRRVPFANMIFIGDGDTDIPCFRTVKELGGHSIAVHPDGDAGRAARTRKLIAEGRVHCAVPADYREGAELERRVLAILDLLAAREAVTAPTPESEA